MTIDIAAERERNEKRKAALKLPGRATLKDRTAPELIDKLLDELERLRECCRAAIEALNERNEA